MSNYGLDLLTKELLRISDKIEDLKWWIRTLEGLIQNSKQYSESDIESFRQKHRHFNETKESYEDRVKSLRAAIKKLRRKN